MDRQRTFVLGLGNLNRRDDGWGWFAINEVRARLGMSPLSEYDDGLDALGHEVDCVFVPQLVPELAETAAKYNKLVIMDARVAGESGVQVNTLVGEQKTARLLSHEFSPADFVSLMGELYHSYPSAYLVSVKGCDYDFGIGLSEEVAALLPQVVGKVLEIILK